MASDARDDVPKISQLVELTSDAIVVCDYDGAIAHANGRFLELVGRPRDVVMKTDLKDLLYTESFERAPTHGLPFPLDSSRTALWVKLADGSFIPVEARAIPLSSPTGELRKKLSFTLKPSERVLVVISNMVERYEHDRQTRRVLSELQTANKRLSGTLSVIMATVGADNLPEMLDSVLNKLTEALDAGGATMYFAENGGFRLLDISESLTRSFVPEFIPYGTGIPTYVLRAARPCRISVVPAGEGTSSSGVFYDLDQRTTHPLRVQEAPPFKTLIAVPVFFGQQVMGIMELGWTRPRTPRRYDVSMVEVICDYLSIQLVSLIASTQSRRAAELTRSLNTMRDTVFSAVDDRTTVWAEVSSEVRRVLDCHICPVVYDAKLNCYVLDYEGGSQVPLPGGIDWLTSSTTAPAAQWRPAATDYFSRRQAGYGGATDDYDFARVTRIDRLSRVGEWLLAHDLPNQGVFVELGPRTEDGYLSAAPPPADPAAAGLITQREASRADLCQNMLFLRDSTQEPIDDVEYDYLVRMMREFGMHFRRVEEQEEDYRIAQTLQSGMQSSLATVPGITSDCLYSSATRQALVGGDFYTLIRLPDDRAVMILGDVSGKGVEAASMSAFVKTALTAYAWEGASPVHMVRSLNSMLMGFSRVETFATMFVAKIDLRRRRATYCSAGHPPSMLLRQRPLGGGSGGGRTDTTGAAVAGGGMNDGPTGGSETAAGSSARAADAGAAAADDGPRTTELELLSRQSGVVGAFEGMSFESGSFTYEPGDMLFMYTDGVIEARSPTGEFFGEQRLRDVLLARASEGVEGLCQKVLDELDAFTDSVLEDDIALVALRFD